MIFYNVFRQEIKCQLRSVVFWLLILVIILFFVTQFGLYRGTEKLEPQPGQQFYGASTNLTHEQEMQRIEQQLARDLSLKQTLRIGIINKRIKIQSEALKAMEELQFALKDKTLSFNDFGEKANEIDRLLGGKTIYGDKQRKLHLSRPLSFEEAKRDFEIALNQEGLTNAYGRLLADYLGITAGFFPIFIAAFLLGRDRTTKMAELINVRNFNALVYVFAKYLAVVFLLCLVYLIVTVQPTLAFYKISSTNGWGFQPLGFVKYVAAWVFPTLMFTTALGMLVAELTGSGIAAVSLQLLLWFQSITVLKGDYSLGKYVIRFNSAYSYDLLVHSLPDITLNRIFYGVLSLVLVVLCALVWGKRRNQGMVKQNVFAKLLPINRLQH